VSAQDGANVIDLFDGYRQLRHEEIDVNEHATTLFSHKAIDMLRRHGQRHSTQPFFM
jgi:hypothetical protein